MKLSALTIDRLKSRIIGDEGSFPRLTGEDILKLFNQVGFKDIYDWKSGGMPGAISRKNYAFEKMTEINESSNLKKLIETVVSRAHFVNNLGMLPSAIAEMNAILAEDNYTLVDTGNDIYKIDGYVSPEPAIVEAHFEENRAKIINEIRKARFTIWVAVAWLTDTGLLSELRKKKEEGLNIQIVTQDDKINEVLKEPVQGYFEAYYKKPRGAYQNLMHHKFCIIDLRTVVHGSYNWTIKAQYNDETVTVTTNIEFATEFAATFMKLKNANDNE
jgi:hypothetical protein